MVTELLVCAQNILHISFLRWLLSFFCPFHLLGVRMPRVQHLTVRKKMYVQIICIVDFFLNKNESVTMHLLGKIY